MGKQHLTVTELEQFPTLADLVQWCGKRDANYWGLCQNYKGEVSFREGGGEWLLQVTLNEVLGEVHFRYGEWYRQNDILIFYGVECFGTNDIYFDTIELSLYSEIIQLCPPIGWLLTQN